MSTIHPLEALLRQCIAIIDSAMGTTIRTYRMTETDVRGDRFRDARKGMLTCGDFFSLTQPKMICDIRRRFLKAGGRLRSFFQKIIEDKFLNDLSWEMSGTFFNAACAASP